MAETDFAWIRHPEAAAFVNARIEELAEANGALQTQAARLARICGTRLIDFLDHLHLSGSTFDDELVQLGFEIVQGRGPKRWRHVPSMLPDVYTGGSGPSGLALAVDEISGYLSAHGLHRTVEGAPLSLLRRAEISRDDDVAFWVVERRSRQASEPDEEDRSRAMLDCLDAWRGRSRQLEGEEAYDALEGLLRAQIDRVGPELAAWAFFRSEREYWESQNRAGRILGSLQRSLGMGWSNHDHHTFRSSRASFHRLLRFAQQLGCRLRERYYAGDEAGWGAQVVEHDTAGLACFLDVDLDPEERDLDFTAAPLPASDRLGTVGLWSALHGDGLIRGGIHHLAARCSFDALANCLKAEGVECMAAFSRFPHLRQAFTVGERRLVAKDRTAALKATGRLDEGQTEHFASRGALASHLEIIERNEGYKGFSKKEVSRIIRDTDPRDQKES